MAQRTDDQGAVAGLRQALETMERDSTDGINKLLSVTTAVRHSSARVATRATPTAKLHLVDSAMAEAILGKQG
jgi:hypothetical protein